jgi:hypothetical protein
LCLRIEAEERVVRELVGQSAVVAEVHVGESTRGFEDAIFCLSVREGVDVFPVRVGGRDRRAVGTGVRFRSSVPYIDNQ